MSDETSVHLRRSQLTTPASEPSMMRKAAGTDADGVVLDLEDAVVPAAKAAARSNVADVVDSADWGETSVSCRINALDTEWWYEDVIEVVSAVGDRLDSLVVPKVGTAADVYALETLLEQVESNADLDAGTVGLQPQIESATALSNAAEIAQVSDRLEALVFGPGDYAASVGAPGLEVGQPPDYPGHYWQYPLSRLNRAAKSASLDCLHGPYADIADREGLREACERAAALGCDGTWVIHPGQIEVANEVFAPDPGAARRAERIVAAYRDAEQRDEGAVEVDGTMVDEATVRLARSLLARARAAGVAPASPEADENR